jgi:transcriptional regulator with XRE-family HTH domain
MVRRRRLDRWLSKQELGGLIGLDGEYVSAVEDHQLWPTVDTLIAMADALDTTPADLLRDMEDDAELLLYRQLRERHGFRTG